MINELTYITNYMNPELQNHKLLAIVEFAKPITERTDNKPFVTESSKQISQLREENPDIKKAPRIEIPSQSEKFSFGNTKIHFLILKESNGRRTEQYKQTLKII